MFLEFLTNLLGFGKSAADLAVQRDQEQNTEDMKANKVKEADAARAKKLADDLAAGDAEEVARDLNTQ